MRMSGFVSCLASMMCLFVVLIGPSSAGFWRPVQPTYPTNPNDPYYQAFATTPPPNVTAKNFMTNFLGYHNTSTRAVITKRQAIIEDIVIVLDGSGSIGLCEFKKGKEALKHVMTTAQNPQYDTKYGAVTFASTATVNFKFLAYSSAASEITNISYPNGWTNTQAGLAEAKKLFDDPNSGRRSFPTRRMVLLSTDGQSNVHAHLTIPNAKALKNTGVEIYVVAVGAHINGIDEIVKVASYPPDRYLYRVKDLTGFWNIIKLIVKEIYPGKYSIVNYDPPC